MNKITFDNEVSGRSGNITYTGGIFTLPKGRCYKIIAGFKDLLINISGYGFIQIYNKNTSTFVGNQAGGDCVMYNSTKIPGSTATYTFNLIDSITDGTFSIRPNGLGGGMSASIDGGFVIIEELPKYSIINTIDVSQATIKEWEQYNPTITATANPTFGSGYSLKAIYKVIGKTLTIKVSYAQTVAGTSGNGVYYFSLPSGYTIDLAKNPVPSSIVATTGNTTPSKCIPLGFGKVYTGELVVVPLNSTSVGLYIHDASNSGLIGSTLWPMSTAGMYYIFSADIPIL
jgi:hypothetical protein